ncbi:GNAT family N-acetyltransferase [Haloarcula nitratireducens]|uniref:GNAT family N-acetyltransferase n=1 Tax=Haloarcula nitratireducens TaxID=2487749 RepID=A0AAW4PCG3_9EURY|nr:GNAT family N-acetyltransferase [Halomicroarcula nitratireducens]MBX0295575.1 GNAT family N-acetyltransferase [Halomicroarcula nitratireducens]
MRVRDAAAADLPDVMNVLDGAALAIDVETVRTSIGSGGALVAVSEDGERVLGALVLDGNRVEAVAVRRRRRGQGIGTALVEAAGERRERLTAAFDADVAPFYRELGFEIEDADEPGRRRGQR